MHRLHFLLMMTMAGVVGCEDREAVRRRQTVNNLKQLGLAMHAYNATNSQDENANKAGVPVDSQATPKSHDEPAVDEVKSDSPK